MLKSIFKPRGIRDVWRLSIYILFEIFYKTNYKNCKSINGIIINILASKNIGGENSWILYLKYIMNFEWFIKI